MLLLPNGRQPNVRETVDPDRTSFSFCKLDRFPERAILEPQLRRLSVIGK